MSLTVQIIGVVVLALMVAGVAVLLHRLDGHLTLPADENEAVTPHTDAQGS